MTARTALITWSAKKRRKPITSGQCGQLQPDGALAIFCLEKLDQQLQYNDQQEYNQSLLNWRSAAADQATLGSHGSWGSSDHWTFPSQGEPSQSLNICWLVSSCFVITHPEFSQTFLQLSMARGLVLGLSYAGWASSAQHGTSQVVTTGEPRLQPSSKTYQRQHVGK